MDTMFRIAVYAWVVIGLLAYGAMQAFLINFSKKNGQTSSAFRIINFLCSFFMLVVGPIGLVNYLVIFSQHGGGGNPFKYGFRFIP